MSEWWNSLQARERVFILGGSIVLAVFLVTWLGLRPLFTHSSATAQRVAEKEILLADLRAASAQLASRPATAARLPATGESLVVIVDRSSREAGLAGALKRNQPVGEDGIRVRFEGASFDQIMAWLGGLSASHGIDIESAAFESASEPGIVQANLTLKRGQS